MNNLTLELLKKRDLDGSLFLITCVPVNIYMTEASNYVNQRKLYLFFGSTLDGKRKYLFSVLGKEVPKTSDWYNAFQELKSRKLEHVIFALLPDIKGIKEAMRLSFPKIEIFNSCDKTIEKLKKYNSYKVKDEIYNEVKKLYVAKDVMEYKVNYDGFVEKYHDYPFIMDLLNDELKGLERNYKYSFKVRRVIYAFNYMIELNKRLERISNWKTYSTKEEFLENLLVYIHSSEMAIPFVKNEWLEVINEIYEDKKDLIKPYL